MTRAPTTTPTLRCSFCHAPEAECANLLQGPAFHEGGANICDTCVDLAHEIVSTAREKRAAEVA